MSRDSDQSVLKCSCGGGDAKTLDVLRQTSLADLAVEDFNYLVAAVNAAGGVAKTIGLPRVLIQKAIVAFNEGVAKGDYVGHPFRGNQWTDAAGVGRGGAGSGNSADMANRQLARMGEGQVMFEGLKASVKADLPDDKEANKLVARAERYGIDTEAGKDALNDLRDHLENENRHTLAEAVNNVLNPRVATSRNRDAVAEAEETVRNTVSTNVETTESETADIVRGLEVLEDRAKRASADAIGRREQAENMDELDDDAQPSLLERRLDNEVRSQKRAAEAASAVRQAVERARQLLVKVAVATSNAKSLNDLRTNLAALNKTQKSLENAARSMRQTARAENNNARRLGVSQNPTFGLLADTLDDMQSRIGDVIADIEEAPSAALEAAREIAGG